MALEACREVAVLRKFDPQSARAYDTLSALFPQDPEFTTIRLGPSCLVVQQMTLAALTRVANARSLERSHAMP